MRIAMAQITSGTDPDDNLRLVAEHTAAASADGAVLVVFPEATMCRFGVPLGPVAQSLDGPWATGVSQIAVENSVTVIAGMFTPATTGESPTPCWSQHLTAPASATTRSTCTTPSASGNRPPSHPETSRGP